MRIRNSTRMFTHIKETFKKIVIRYLSCGEFALRVNIYMSKVYIYSVKKA